MTALYNLLSSANFSILLDTTSSMSFIYIKNRAGPKTEPCRTQIFTGDYVEVLPNKTTLCSLPKANLGSNSKLCHLCHKLLIYTLACDVALYQKPFGSPSKLRQRDNLCQYSL